MITTDKLEYRNEFKPNDIIAVFESGECEPGVILISHKQKAHVQFLNGKMEWIEKKRILAVTDKKLVDFLIAQVHQLPEKLKRLEYQRRQRSYRKEKRQFDKNSYDNRNRRRR